MKIRNLLFPFAILLIAAGVADASEADFCSKPLRVAMFEYGVLYRNSTNEGVDVLLLDALEKRSGCTFVRVVMPRARIWAELQSGTLDMATAAIPTAERRVFGYLLPYMTTRNQVLIRKAAGQVPNSMESLEKSSLRVGAVRGFRHEPAYDAMLGRLAGQGRVKEVVDVQELLRFLDRGLVDAVLSQPVVYREYMDARYLNEELVFRDWAPKNEVSPGAMILSRKSFTPEQAQRWDRLVVDILNDQTMYKILKKFVPSSEARGLVYRGPRDPSSSGD